MARSRMSRSHAAILVVALILHLAAGLFLLVSGLVAPLWAVALMLIIWAGLLGFGYLNRQRPWIALLMPVAAAVTWFVVVSLGSAIFGWTA